MKRISCLLIITFILLTLSGCANSNNTDEPTEYEKMVLEFAESYNATHFEDVLSQGKYSADIIDNYKSKNIYIDWGIIKDIFYENDNLCMTLHYSYYEDYYFKLNISREQFDNIKKFDTSGDGARLDLIECVVFRLDNITSDIFDISIFTEDDYSAEITKNCVIEGTLIDIKIL